MPNSLEIFAKGVKFCPNLVTLQVGSMFKFHLIAQINDCSYGGAEEPPPSFVLTCWPALT